MRSEVVLDILQVISVLQFWHSCMEHLKKHMHTKNEKVFLCNII